MKTQSIGSRSAPHDTEATVTGPKKFDSKLYAGYIGNPEESTCVCIRDLLVKNRQHDLAEALSLNAYFHCLTIIRKALRAVSTPGRACKFVRPIDPGVEFLIVILR